MPLVIERPLEDLSPNNSLIHQPTKCPVPLYGCHQVRGWACIVCCDGTRCHLKLQNMFCPVISFQTEPVKTVKYSESTHYVSFRAIANDSVASHALPRIVSQSLRDFHFFFFFLIQGEEFPPLTNLYFNAITSSP